MKNLRSYIKTLLLENQRAALNIPIPEDLMEIHGLMKHAGKKLYLVGGAVRDALQGKAPEDYDLATDAEPEKVMKILRRDHTLDTKITGESFGVVRVKTSAGEEYEIATFRKDIGKGRRPDSVEWVGMEEDAKRRDLTINALYYDLETREVIDFVGGIEDVQNRVIRTVGDPAERFDEDRLRILRVPRFAARMGSSVDETTKEAILQDNELLEVSAERIKEEILKGIKQALSVRGFFQIIEELELMPQVFPGLRVSPENIDDSSRLPQVVLAQSLLHNDSTDVKNTLRGSRYSNEQLDHTAFLIDFAQITPQTAPQLKKAFVRLRVDPSMLDSFVDQKTLEAFKQFVEEPDSVNPRDLIAQGLKGPEIGKALASAASDRFGELLAEQTVRLFARKTLRENSNDSVLGYLKPVGSFFTLAEWEDFCNKMLEFQRQGYDTRGGGISLHSGVMELVNTHFDFQINTEVNRYELLTYKNVMDFIEDFVNHRFWGLENEFGHYFPDITSLRFAYFYSRGDLEPYALIDDEFTTQLYGSVWNPKHLMHYTSANGISRIQSAIQQGRMFDISSFTVAEREFFRESSDHVIEFVGNVRAGFRSDIKSFATDSGRRAVNLHRLEYPGKDLNNICYELDSCDGSVRTSLWNEYIATPLKILKVKKLK